MRAVAGTGRAAEVWTTKLAYVSNAQFEDAELTELIGKMRSGAIAGMIVGDVQEMAALLDSRCNPVVTHPQYTAWVAARQERQVAM